jgi:hypothetical protein
MRGFSIAQIRKVYGLSFGYVKVFKNQLEFWTYLAWAVAKITVRRQPSAKDNLMPSVESVDQALTSIPLLNYMYLVSTTYQLIHNAKQPKIDPGQW